MMSTISDNSVFTQTRCEDETSQNTDEELEASSKLKRRKSVSFGAVSCRFYERTAGNHPDVSCGPPLTFNWSYHTAPDVSLEDFEAVKGGKKLSHMQLIIPKRERIKILLQECGLSQSSIASCVRQVNRLKTQRRRTIQNLMFEERFQSFCKVLFKSTKHFRQDKE